MMRLETITYSLESDNTMPKAFDRCVKAGGKVRTMTGPSGRFNLKTGEYRHICYIGKKTFWGHKKTKSKENK